MQKIILKTKIAAIILIVLMSLTSCKTTPIKEESLIDLIKAGKTEEIKERFNGNAVNMKDEEENSLLHIAVLQNNPAIIRFLISMDAEIEAKNIDGDTPLLLGLKKGRYNAVNALIQYNPNIFAYDNERETPFSFAFKNNLANLILTSQTIHQKNENQDTPLHLTVRALDKKTTKQILDIEKPSANCNTEGLCPLGIAYKKHNFEEAAEIASMLLLSGFLPKGQDFAEFETAVLARNLSMRFGDGETLLHIFARKGYTGFLKFLIKNNVPIDAKDVSSSTAMQEAVYNGNVEASILLLEAGADPNSRNSSGNTALHLVMPEASRSKYLQPL